MIITSSLSPQRWYSERATVFARDDLEVDLLDAVLAERGQAPRA